MSGDTGTGTGAGTGAGAGDGPCTGLAQLAALVQALAAVDLTDPCTSALHVRMGLPADPEWVPGLLARLALAPGLTCTPWRQSLHRHYMAPKNLCVTTVTQHDPDVDVVRVTHGSTTFLRAACDAALPGTAPAAAAADLAAEGRCATGPTRRRDRHVKGPDTVTTAVLAAASGGCKFGASLATAAVVRLLWDTAFGPTVVVLSGRRERQVGLEELPLRVDAVPVTTLRQSCTFTSQPVGHWELGWRVEVGLQWTAASTTGTLQALKQGDDPMYFVTLVMTNLGPAVKARGCHYVTLDVLFKMADLLGVTLTQPSDDANGAAGAPGGAGDPADLHHGALPSSSPVLCPKALPVLWTAPKDRDRGRDITHRPTLSPLSTMVTACLGAE
jgi:hypothetical protein